MAEPLPKLHVMAIDPHAPHEPMLDPVTFSLGMERLKQAGYEYVIIDSPPVLGSLDCNVISDAVDATILTALPMKSLRRAMRQAVEQLEPAPILGVVVLEGRVHRPSHDAGSASSKRTRSHQDSGSSIPRSAPICMPQKVSK